MQTAPDPAAASEPTRAQIDARSGWLLLEFGAGWCGHCQLAKPLVTAFVQRHGVPYQWVEDGKGRPLGRSFSVKLWPTLILLRDGHEVGRVVRPAAAEALGNWASMLAT